MVFEEDTKDIKKEIVPPGMTHFCIVASLADRICRGVETALPGIHCSRVSCLENDVQ